MSDVSSTLNHGVVRAHGFEDLEVEGTLPSDLRGTLYRTGPGLLHRFGRAVHPFEADGAVTAVRFDGRARGACRLIESGEYRDEEEAGRFLYNTSASFLRKVTNRLGGRAKPTGNTNILVWQRRIFALVEDARPVELEPENLATRGTTDLGVVRTAFSGHPHRVEALKTTFNFGVRDDVVDLFALPDAGAAARLGSFKLPWRGMIHDFIATERHLVFLIGPAKLVRWRAVLGVGDLARYFDWDPAAGTAVVVVPLADPARVTRFFADAFWIWHFVNAFEDGDDIVVDACRHDNVRVLDAPSTPGPEAGAPRLTRFRLNARRESLTRDTLWTGLCEFPSVHPAVTGARQRFTWLQTYPDLDQAPGVARFDCETGALVRWAAPTTHLGVEPIFVPRGGGEARGFVLQLMRDPARGTSYLAVLDAECLADGPVARVWFRQPVPMTFHGAFAA